MIKTSKTQTKTNVEPYLFFGGRCEEALAFYKKAIGADIGMIMHYKESPEAVPSEKIPAGFENKVMHATLRIGDTTVMVSDGNAAGTQFKGFSLCLNLSSVVEADTIFRALAEGGQVTLPLAKTFYSPRFGMLQDKFGVGWMINVVQ